MTTFKIKNISLTFLLLSLLFTSCNGQSQSYTQNLIENSETLNIGDTVANLGNDIACIFEDKSGNYWFASNGEGVFCYNGKFITQITEKHGLCSNYVWKVEEDINGNLWFATRDGYCSLENGKIVNYTTKIKKAFYGKLKYKTGGLFFNHLNGICFYNGTSFTNFTIHPANYIPPTNTNYRPYDIYSTLVDKTGKIWLGTQEKGVCMYDGEKFIFLDNDNLGGPAVRCLFEDKNGTLWFGNNGGGLFRYDGKTLSNITEENKLGNTEFLKGNFNDKPGSLARVWTINEDTNGNLFIGTIDAGVWKFDGTNLTNYTTKDGLTGNSIWTIFKDKKGELWFVTDGESICKFNGETFEKFEFNQLSSK